MMLLLLCVSGLSISGNLVDASYLYGDAMVDITQQGPNGEAYPSNLIEDLYQKGVIGTAGRRGRALHPIMDPMDTKNTLLKAYQAVNQGGHKMPTPTGRSLNGGDSMAENLVAAGASVKTSSSRVVTSSSFSTSEGRSPEAACPPGPPARLCKTRYNTTAPMYGVSLTSGNPVTIVQKFPDLLQQVIFEVCETDTCDVIQGSCVQTYVPYLFLVIPLGPVTLTGQDYVLVESGCVCQPKYAAPSSAPSPIDALQG